MMTQICSLEIWEYDCLTGEVEIVLFVELACVLLNLELLARVGSLWGSEGGIYLFAT